MKGVVEFFKELVFQKDTGYIGLSHFKHAEETAPKLPAKTKSSRKDIKISDLIKGNLSDY